MKKLLIFLTLILTSLTSFGQLIGLGTIGSPFSGTFGPGDNLTWSGNIYVNGDIFVDNEQLTISPGTTVFFTISGADLIITGTGQLNANGTISSQITFTKGTGNSSWGHISFQSMTAGFTGVSIINYCIVEYGQKNPTPFGDEARGGGINSTFSYLTISNSIIRNNYAGFGGGICVSSNANSSISNCIITNNTAGTTGGGILLDQNPFSKVENCIISNNTSSGNGGGGGVFIGDNSTNATISNCTIVSNISTLNRGNNIRFYFNNSSPSPKFYNTIVWGSNGSIDYPGQTPHSDDFNYCAIQGYTTGYTNCINLNGTNNNPAGPNFVDPNNLNYAITALSPCRNAGTSTGAPTTDFLGRTRVLPYDIGAYEYFSILWKLTAVTTDWTNPANWDGGVPSSSDDIVIPAGAANYPTNTPAPDFTIGTGSTMIIGPGAKATLGSFTNNGTFMIQSDAASGAGSFIVNSYSGNNVSLELFLTGGNPGAPTLKLNKWHFISTPVTLLPVSTFTSITQNVVGWYDNQVSGTLATGWIAFDGYRYSTGGLGGPTFSNLTPGNGYDYYATTDQKYTFSGQLNTSNVPVSLSFNVNDALHGFNLLGNPFSSGLNWDDIVNNIYFPFPANTSKSLYFTRDNAQCSYNGGVGIPSDVTGIIPPMQGFFIKTYGSGNTITIPAGARIQGNIHARYKKGLEIIPLIRLTLTEGTLTDETVVRFDPAAKSGVDYDFDAPKMFLSADILSIYSTSEGSNFAINGQPFPQTFVEIPIVVNLLAIGDNSITATQLQGLDNYVVTLTDNVTGTITNLKTTPNLTFTGTTGTSASRFILKVGTITTGIENPVVSKNTFNIYPANSMINIQTNSDVWEGKSGSVKVMDLTGRTIRSVDNSEFSKNSLTRIASPGIKGIYMVEIKSGMLRYVGKVVIK